LNMFRTVQNHGVFGRASTDYDSANQAEDGTLKRQKLTPQI
jgi:hypothetical protein